ncbi:MHS family MFS transporter [Propioniferax innocua]
MRRVAVASCAGTTIEFYDFFIYGTAAALVFPSLFFSAFGEKASVVVSFATFGVAFLARPLGAVIFGHFGDRIGRKKTLIWTLLLMGIATVLIGLLPDAKMVEHFGLPNLAWAPGLALVILRICQGLAVGGEWAGATLLAAEYAPPKQRGLYAVFPQVGPAIAFFLSSGTFLTTNLIMGDENPAFLTFGWRVPFMLSALLVIVGLWVRVSIDETPMFKAQASERASDDRPTGERPPLLGAIVSQPKEVLLGGGALTMLFCFFYMGTAFLTSYGSKSMGLSRPLVLAIGMGAAVVFAASITFAGIYSDRIGRRKMILISCVVAIPWGFVLFMILGANTPLAFALGLMGTLAIFGLSYGPAGAFLPEAFDTKYRYTGAGMAYNLAGVLGGGVAPLVAASMSSPTHIGYMMAGIGVFSLICTVLMAETRHRKMAEGLLTQ